ncbi:MAG: helix-turn-helix transcriptional regulator [Nitrospirae bacterium]|nr:helix-turn-helix transcriptional regulator [Nitrospirota bacterium]
MSDNNKEFGSRLKELIKQEGLSQRDFAASMNMPLSTLATYCSGRVPDSSILVDIAEHFGVTTDFLLTGRSPWEADVVVGGREIKEGTEKYRTMKEIANADDATLAKIRAIMDLVQGEVTAKARAKAKEAETPDAGDIVNPPVEERKASNH